MKSFLLVLSLVALVSLSACGGGASSVVTPPPQTFTISGMVAGLPTGVTVGLADNGTDTLNVGNGGFTFAKAVSSYSVTVKTQPTGGTCSVTNGSGTATANVTSVTVTCSAAFSISGVVQNLPAGANVKLANNGTDTLTVSTNGQFTFKNLVAIGGSYNVTVQTQPTNATCTVTNASGTATQNVTSVQVSCVVSGFTISGVVSGLPSGGTVGLANNGTDTFTTGNGPFTFAKAVSGAYLVTVSTQPAGGVCTVTNGSGTATANVSNITVNCVGAFTISGTLSGLPSGTSVVVADNITDTLTLTANGQFTFKNTVPSGAAYNVTILTQPTGTTCTVTGGSGTALSAVTSVVVTCGSGTGFTISGTVTGLPTGITVGLADNLTDTLSATTGFFTFAKTVASGSPYSVTITTQPTGGLCTVTNGTGTATANVTNVTVTCVGAFTISGTLSGLPTGASIVVADNLTDTLTLTANAQFTFKNSVGSGSPYSVTVLTQPAGASCTVANGSGTAQGAVTNITVTCTATTTVTIGGTVTGLPTGASVGLSDNLNDPLTVSSNSAFTFAKALNSGSAYSVTVTTQPAGATCSVANGSGTATANITNVAVTCSATNFTIGGSLSGLPTGSSIVLADNTTDTLTVTANGTFTFGKTVASGGAYAVTVQTQPIGATCAVTNGSGAVTANVSNVTVTCTAANYTIGGTMTGLPSGSTVVVSDNTTDTLTLTVDGTFTFTKTVPSGSAYSVAIKTQPTGGTCSVSGGSGTATANVTTVAVNCAAVTYTIGGSLSGLASGTSVVVADNTTDTLTLTANNTFTFTKALASGSAYAVTVLTQPSGQNCTVTNGNGTATANVSNVLVVCVATPGFTIGGTLSGLGTGDTVVLSDNTTDTLSLTANATFTFAKTVLAGGAYAVAVKTQPSGQICTVSNGSGTANANVTNVSVTCASTATLTLSVSVTGLTSGTLTVQDDASKTLSFTGNKTSAFSNTYASGSAYSVTITGQPSGETCTLGSNSAGTITANTTVTATCTTSSGNPTISVAVSGLSGTVELSDDKGDVLTFNTSTTLTFPQQYSSGASYAVNVSSQPTSQACTPTYSSGTITSNITINVVCATGSTRKLGTISAVSTIVCPSGSVKSGVCQQMTVACPGVPNVFAYVKTNTPTGTPLGTVTYGTGTDGNGLYESIYTFGSTAVQNVLNAGFTTVEISWGTPFNNNQGSGWVQGTGGVLAAACRYATVTNWIYNNIQNNTKIPMCATANSGGAGALAYALSQYGSNNVLSMAEITSGPPTGRLDWGCGCQEGKVAVSCGSVTTMGTCFGKVDAPVWDPAYTPSVGSTAYCSNAAVNNVLPPGGLNYFLGDSAEAPGATYSFPKTYVNLVFGGLDNSSAIPSGQDWFNHLTGALKGQECIADAPHSIPNVLDGAQQIATDLINNCKLQ